ncbi:MAG: GNAT family N-acetyltransferase [Chitinophagaceae bacterium]
MPETLSVRELTFEDIEPLTNYWLTADHEFLKSMGVDVSKMPSREQFTAMLTEQLSQSIEEKKSYCIIWLADGKGMGHSNINKIIFGEEAYMHLHLWNNDTRKKGLGVELIKLTLPYYFENFRLKKLYCEPYALNPAPNKTLAKAGFDFVKDYITVPGWINFEQRVNLWEMSYEKYKEITD